MTDKTKNINQAAQALADAFIQFSLALRDSDIAVASTERKTVTKATIKPPRAKAEKVAKAPKAAKAKKAAGGAEMKPCPVTGVMNTHRRFSYLMPEVRTAANLKKYKGWAKKQPQAEAATTAAAPAETAAS